MRRLGVGAVLNWLRAMRVGARRAVRATSLSVRFVIVAAVTVTVATVLLGLLTARVMQDSIVDGVAQAASSSIAALIYPTVQDIGRQAQLSAEDIARLNAVFETSREAETTRLLQFELRRPGGEVIYKADGGLSDLVTLAAVQAAAAGETIAALDDVELAGLGPVASAPLRVLRIITPLDHDGETSPPLVAVLYFSTRALTDILQRSTQIVWSAVIAIGVAVIAALFAVVDRTSQLIIGQRSQLRASLEAWRRLAGENSALHRASEQLRLDAVSANESLLVRMGADIHDGPVQNLTLLILQLSSREAETPEGARVVTLAQETLEELRDISSGLVLPELSALSVEETIRLAVSRHQRWSGATIATDIAALPEAADLAVKICIYRVVQESLSNGYRHGEAGTQRVECSYAEGRVTLAISNRSARNAAGTESQADRIGLVAMRLRVEALGGTLAVELGRQSLVHAVIPLEVRPAAPALR